MALIVVCHGSIIKGIHWNYSIFKIVTCTVMVVENSKDMKDMFFVSWTSHDVIFRMCKYCVHHCGGHVHCIKCSSGLRVEGERLLFTM